MSIAEVETSPTRFARSVWRAPVAACSHELPDDFVPRPRLVARLADPTAPPLAVIAAPAGYGKTALLHEWDGSDERPFAWVVLERGDDDARRFTKRVDQALNGVDQQRPFVLALDDVHVLRSPGSLAALRQLAAGIPRGSRLALASRTEPALPLGRLRAHRTITELHAGDLALTAAESAHLVAADGSRAVAAQVDRLIGRAEGWPAPLYLMALTLEERRGGTQLGDWAARWRAAVRDYLSDILLAELSETAASFLIRTSVLDRLTGPVCDALTGAHDSASVLDEISRSHLLLARSDESGVGYGRHPLVTDMLRGELRTKQPYLEPQLHQRAAEWYAEHGDDERAIEHSIAAGDDRFTGRLLWKTVPRYAASGRADVAHAWVRALGDDGVPADPYAALAAAAVHVTAGDLGAVERCEWVVRGAVAKATPELRPRLETGAAMLRAAAGREGLAAMREDAARACSHVPEDSPWRATACLLEGVADHLSGDLASAERRLEDGARRSAITAPAVQVICLAQLALMAGERGDWAGAAALCARARAQVTHYGLAELPAMALVFAISAFVGASRGRAGHAPDDARRARRLLARLVDFAPWYEAEARAALAGAALRAGDLPAARELLDEAARSARTLPDAPVLHESIARLEEQASSRSAATNGAAPTSLTGAELRILNFLPTHLSFREIADTLYISANTVKTQAHAVYRKLGASSRSQAVAQATELGLLDLPRGVS